MGHGGGIIMLWAKISLVVSKNRVRLKRNVGELNKD